jgi:hypothetical protein
MASNDSSPVQSPENQKGIVRRKKSPLQLGLLEKTYAGMKHDFMHHLPYTRMPNMVSVYIRC